MVKNFGLGGRFTSLVTILPASAVAVAAADVAAADAAAGAEGFTGTTIGRRSFFPPRPKQPREPQGQTQEEVSFWI